MKRAAGLGTAIIALALALGAPSYAAPSAGALAGFVVARGPIGGGGRSGGGGHFGGGGYYRGGGHYGGGGHFRSGVTFGLGIGPWWGYPYPFYYYPPPTVIIRQAPEYYEEDVAPVQPTQRYWYFCRDLNAYYPYVRSCPEGWEKVPAIPPPDE